MSEGASGNCEVSSKATKAGNSASGLSVSVMSGKSDSGGMVADHFFDDAIAAHKMFPNIRDPMLALDLYNARMHPERMDEEDDDCPSPPPRPVLKRKKPVVEDDSSDDGDDRPITGSDKVQVCETDSGVDKDKEDDDCPFWMQDIDGWLNDDVIETIEDLPFSFAGSSIPLGKERSHHCV